jgi:hypothetical protein
MMEFLHSHEKGKKRFKNGTWYLRKATLCNILSQQWWWWGILAPTGLVA